MITPFEAPFKPEAGIAMLRGNLAPDGAVIKPSAASPELMQHTGRAVVFETIEELHHRIDDDALDIDETCIMVLKNCGPKGYPGMAEVGNMPLPQKLLREGRARHDPHLGRAHVRHRLRHGGAARRARGRGRRSAGAGAERRLITLDVAARSLHLHVDEAEMDAPPRGLGAAASRMRRVAMPSSTSTTCCRPTEAPISTFWSARTGSPVPRDNH